ncbi:MAG TPA: hypothetical protein VFA04_02285 [Bryobacteraceae bacterium]|nr:hypothetical protein [Bryobacteraceae bacterium]
MTDIPELLAGAWQALSRAGYDDGKLCSILSQITEHDDSMAVLSRLKSEAGVPAGDDSVERLMLAISAAESLPRISSLALHAGSRKLLENDLRAFLSDSSRTRMRYSDFVRAAKIATLRRFPAGPMEWEISGIPRSWLLKPRPGGMLQLGAFIARRLKGFRPCFFMHVAPRPRNRALILENEVMSSYYRMARSMQLQPDILGIVASAWFYDPRAVFDNPWLEPLSRPLTENGGFIVPLGPADATSGMLEGNPDRRRRFEDGSLSYRIGLAIWPRACAISWADAHPEYDR